MIRHFLYYSVEWSKFSKGKREWGRVYEGASRSWVVYLTDIVRWWTISWWKL